MRIKIERKDARTFATPVGRAPTMVRAISIGLLCVQMGSNATNSGII